ncbi:zinc finger MYM-type protein 1-like [Tachysurus vachellii]|uniref:zinc finger MYM-type protein 1-like n=1 Tax=Tachysurus vachellii TaxID=175792 RepID=UPI00296ADEFA|nr:zinc finger MYM-type protein 1-like [Tachysurus vachellii]
MDGAQDLSGKEQESVCLRYVDHDLIVHEEFVGMYEVSVTTGENLAKVLKDVLLRLNLSITGLRGQAYDGAANMAGIYSGAQAIIKESQPLALYVHCGLHCVNLITQHACTSPVIRDSLQWVHEVGGLFRQSVKMKSIFQDISESESGSITAIRPLCPTRWTVRIRAVLKQYQPMLLALEEMSCGHSVSACRANGLSDRFQKGNVLLGLLLALEVTEELECLNASLQSRSQTVDGMLAAVNCVKDTIAKKRTEDAFQSVYDKATQMSNSLNLSPIEMPRVRNPPKRFSTCSYLFCRILQGRIFLRSQRHFWQF